MNQSIFRVSSHLAETRSPPVENFLATVLVSQLGTAESTVYFLRTIRFCLHHLNSVFSIHSIGFRLRATQAGMKTSTK